ncbi:MAG: sugar phosphate nucleotidyltransferase [Chloroflexi bacterium]|nr:sugar phosphate nucleotidyltransferase [Chloroflexota bacterium]
MKAIILAGGKGTRLLPYTKVIPKPLMPIGDMPILEVLVHQVKRAGVDEIILSVGHLASLLQAFFQDGTQLGTHIRYSYENIPLGTVGPLTIIPGLDQTFLVMNGDVLTDLEFSDLIAFHRESQALVTIAMHKRQVKIDLGVIQLASNSQNVIGYIEKPTYDYQVSMGIYVFEPAALQYIPKDTYYDFPTLILELIKQGQKVAGYPFNGYWQDLGRPDDYERAIQDFDSLRSTFLKEVPA